MAEEDFFEETEEVETPPPAGEGPKGLREQLNKVEAENAQLRGVAMRSILETIGLQPEAGLGKALAKEYKGQFTVEAVSDYAKTEYGHEYAIAPTNTAEVVTADRISQITGQSEPVVPTPPVDQAAQITGRMHDPEAGRVEAEQSIAVKMQQFAQENYPGTQ